LRVRGSKTKRAWDAKDIVRLHTDSSWLRFYWIEERRDADFFLLVAT
jgi:hypothetical protein